MKTAVMGIVNVTPDSFSDGGMYYRPEEAMRRAENLVDEGADIIDLGAESTRPGAEPVTPEEEWRRLEPVLVGLGHLPVPISVDTRHPETARRALQTGAQIINCVYAPPIPEMLKLLREFPESEIAMPAECHPSVVNEPDLLARTYLDPMIGFGTSRDQDLALLRSVPELARKGRVLVGASRKRIVKKLTGERVTGKTLGGNVGLAAWCAMNGACAVRVHDVKETVQALKIIAALEDRQRRY